MDPELKIPSDYADTAVEQCENDIEEIESVYSIADAARAAGVYEDTGD